MKQKLNIALLGVFGSQALNDIFSSIIPSVISTATDYNVEIIRAITITIWLIFNLTTCLSLFYIVFTKGLPVSVLAKVGAWISGALIAFFAINNIVYLTTGIQIFDFFGIYSNILEFHIQYYDGNRLDIVIA